MSLDVRPSKKDRNKIDLTDDAVAHHWSKKLGRTKEEIAAAVAKVGDNCESVKRNWDAWMDATRGRRLRISHAFAVCVTLILVEPLFLVLASFK